MRIRNKVWVRIVVFIFRNIKIKKTGYKFSEKRTILNKNPRQEYRGNPKLNVVLLRVLKIINL